MVHDVQRRWCSTQGLVKRLAIKFHYMLDDIAPLLSSVEWCVARLLLTALEPFMWVHKELAFNKVIGYLTVPLTWDVQISLTVALA